MIYFGLGYGAGIWLAFLVIVLWQLPGHPHPAPFAQMFLLLHPIWVAGLGLELLIAIPAERRSNFRRLLQKRTISRISVVRAGLCTGLLASIAAAVFGAFAYFISPWLALGALPVLLFSPVIGFTLFGPSPSLNVISGP